MARVRAFTELYLALDATTRTGAKVEAMRRYFTAAPAADAAWALHFLIGDRPRAAVTTTRLKAWAMELAGIPEWLFARSHGAVGDLAETIALLLPPPAPGAAAADRPLAEWAGERLAALAGRDEAAQRALMRAAWAELDTPQRLLWNKMITGSLRVGVSRLLAVQALAAAFDLDRVTLAQRLAGGFAPSAEAFRALTAPPAATLGSAAGEEPEGLRPYPFMLAHPLAADPHTLGTAVEWQAEWKWDGIRGQIVRRAGDLCVWSRGEELITAQFPEFAALRAHLPEGTVLDGEIVVWRDGQVRPFAELQRRLNRKAPPEKIAVAHPVVLLAYDLLQAGGQDLRGRPLRERRARLETLLGSLPADLPLALSATVPATDWEELRAARGQGRARGAEGLMLKRLSSAYGVGRVRGDWWKWKVEPYSVDAVLIYAQPGSGKRAGLFTDYTFGVWADTELVPFAKAYSGLTDAEITEVDRFVRRHTLERFGPVHRVRPELVFEIGFEGIQVSRRHKCGVAVRFPRMLRWRRDKPAAEADCVDTLLEVLAAGTAEGPRAG